MAISRSAARPTRTPRHPIERGDLINIAARLFAELGYAAASLGEIAEAAGLRKASLYHHFPTKEALYAAVLDTAVVELRALLIGARLDEGDFAERLDRLGALITDYFADHPYAANLLSREMLENTAYLQGAGGEAIRINLEATTAFLAAGMDAGAFRRQDPRHLALSIVGLHVFYFASATATGRFLGGCVLVRARSRTEGVRARASPRSLPGRQRSRTVLARRPPQASLESPSSGGQVALMYAGAATRVPPRACLLLCAGVSTWSPLRHWKVDRAYEPGHGRTQRPRPHGARARHGARLVGDVAR